MVRQLRSGIRRCAVLGAMILAGAGISLVTAAPASADINQCLSYLRTLPGVVVGEGSRSACAAGNGAAGGQWFCRTWFRDNGLTDAQAIRACDLAAQ
ncbi:hypothetical protein ABZ639_26555 [Saccharomonospora sp. NPDC006951]